MLNSLILAAEEATETSALDDLGIHVMAAVIFTAIGVVVFLLVFWMIVKLTPFSIKKEIEEDQNTSLAIIIGSVLIGIAIIIAAAIHG